MTVSYHPHQYRWNFRLWVLETSTWMLATAFLDTTTVLPVLVMALSDSPFLASMLLSLRYAGQGWPQLIAASLISGRAQRKAFYIRVVVPGRLLLLWPAILLLYGVQNPALTVTAILVGYFAFWISEGFSIVPWVDMVGKTIPTVRRGRLFAAMHVVGGILGILAGLLVRHLLQRADLPFPTAYGVLFLLAMAALVISTAAIALLHEPPSPPHEERYSTSALIRDIPNLLRSMPPFRLLVILQALFGFAILPAPLYILYSTEILREGIAGAAGAEAIGVGVFLAVQTAGMIIGNATWGHLSDQYGNRLLLRVLAFIHILVPLAAVLAGLVAPGLPPWALYLIFFPTFFGFGGLFSGTWMAVTNYLLEIAPEHDRPAYIAVTNALNLPAIILPMAGGLLLRLVGYNTIFLFAAAVLLYAFFLSAKLSEPRVWHPHAPHPEPGTEGSSP